MYQYLDTFCTSIFLNNFNLAWDNLTQETVSLRNFLYKAKANAESINKNFGFKLQHLEKSIEETKMSLKSVEDRIGQKSIAFSSVFCRMETERDSLFQTKEEILKRRVIKQEPFPNFTKLVKKIKTIY